MRTIIFALGFLGLWCTHVSAQDLRVATVTRPPFSMEQDGIETGFSLDLMNALAEDLGKSLEIVRVDRFSEMLDLVKSGEVDAATANISITAKREMQMDFTQPIFESGLQIMMPADALETQSIWRAILSVKLLLAIMAAFAALMAVGMLMWFVERKKQPYFDIPAREALFPAFWWALNLVVNGGFEERVPRSRLGRFFGVTLVLSSLFIVSIFVAQITASMTVSAIQTNISSINDLHGHSVGTTENSTSSAALERRDIGHQTFDGLGSMFSAFEAGDIDAIVFDAPVLAHYVTDHPARGPKLIGPVFNRDNYGIALPTNSPFAEDINLSLLNLRENGTYDELIQKWFGMNSGF